MQMKQLKDYVNENHERNFLSDYRTSCKNNAPLVSLNRSNAKRMFEKHSIDGFIIISPCRGYADFDIDVEDKDARQQLNTINSKRIRDMIIQIIIDTEYSYMPVYGEFIENIGTDNEKKVYEKSLIIFNHDKDGNEFNLYQLFELGVNLSKQFNQDSFLFIKPGESPKYYDKDGKLEFECDNNVTFNDYTKQYWNNLHKNTMKYKDETHCNANSSFTDCYINPTPQNFSERYSRYMNQEIFIDTK